MILLVLGMHRSGTSAVTRTLTLMGAQVPGTLMEPVPGENPLGFWESREIVESHDRFLAAAGSCWDDMRPLPARAFRGRPARVCKDELTLILEKALAESPLLAVKDPRLCRLLPLWGPVLHGLGVESRAVLPLRNPLEVAHSLKTRNGIERERALAMWLVHSLVAERESRGMIRHVAPYGAFLDSPREAVAEMAARLGGFDRTRVEEALPAIESFWRKDLRHHIQSDSELAADPDTPTWVKDAYRLLLSDPLPAKALDDLWGELQRALEGFGHYLDPALLERRQAADSGRMERSLEALELLVEQSRVAAEKDGELALAAARAAEAERVLAGKDADLARLSALVLDQERSLAEREVALARQTGQLREKEAEIARSAAQLEETSRLSAERAREVTRLSSLAAEQARTLAHQAGQLEATSRELADRNDRLTLAAAAAAVQAERLGEKEAALAGALTGMTKQAAILSALEEDHQALIDRTEELERIIALRKADLARQEQDLATLRRAAEASDAAREEEKQRNEERLQALGVAIRELEASLDRQRTHLAVLAFAPGRPRG